MQDVLDDKSEYCISFIYERLQVHRQKWKNSSQIPPLYLGINGVQGAGKTVLASSLAGVLSQPHHRIPSIVLSIDDFYLTHELQTLLATRNPDNRLVKHRGQPSTHDLPLALSVFSSLRDGKETHIPRYEKSAFNGQGDRVAQKEWKVVNSVGQATIKLVILEGWCVGFRALEAPVLQMKWEKAMTQRNSGQYQGRLGWTRLEDVEFVNEALSGYDILTDQLDAMIHMDAENLTDVYEWRLEQEAALRQAKGTGMTNEQVIEFVNGYYPAYELYIERLRIGAFGEEKGKQLRLLIGSSRKVIQVVKL